jgi:hypothetical protein
MEFLLSHKVEILAVLLAVSELLGNVKSVKENSIFQVVVGLIKKVAGK